MGVTFHGNGSVFIPSSHSFIRFVDGKYTTDKAREIEVLALTFEHDNIVVDRVEAEEHKEPRKPRAKKKELEAVQYGDE